MRMLVEMSLLNLVLAVTLIARVAAFMTILGANVSCVKVVNDPVSVTSD